MEILKYCKMQIAFLVIFILISYIFIKDGSRLNKKSRKETCNHYFDLLFVLGEVAIILDGVTSYTVNHLEQIPGTINIILHLLYMLIYQIIMFVLFMYWLSVTDNMPDTVWKKIGSYVPITISVLATIIEVPKIYYIHGKYTNYSMGIPAYICFIVIAYYGLMTTLVFFIRGNYVKRSRRTAFIFTITAVFVISAAQIFKTEALVASVAVILVILSIYLCMEDPSVKYLELYHNEMVMGFATLVESKDGSTGGHIRRSSAYAVLIADQLRKNSQYSRYITTDYIDNLKKAAPMHDVGKIGVPDNILQKPGKLTEEEYEVMKKHPEIGSKIIEETFGHLNDQAYEHMAYKVALYHHEKWNGKGYPCGLKETDIPLCARIMAVADVFDAVSAKRCYRDAMPLDVCYKIIREGRSQDFDPDVVDAFFAKREEVENIYNTMK